MQDPHDADFEEASSRLVEGLKSCHSVVKNYRAMISGESGPAMDRELPLDSGDGEG